MSNDKNYNNDVWITMPKEKYENLTGGIINEYEKEINDLKSELSKSELMRNNYKSHLDDFDEIIKNNYDDIKNSNKELQIKKKKLMFGDDLYEIKIINSKVPKFLKYILRFF